MSEMVPSYAIAGLIGAASAMAATNKFWYPPPDIHGAALGLLAAAILLGGAAVGMSLLWIVAWADDLARRQRS
jgi:nitrate/nitrite transporter NarK